LCEKVVELDFLYPSDGIHRRWESGYRITSMAATADQAAFILSVPKRKMMDETQETLRTTAFPSTHVKVGFFSFEQRLDFCFVSIILIRTCPVLVDFAGKMGEKSVHCINMLWEDSLLRYLASYESQEDNWRIRIIIRSRR